MRLLVVPPEYEQVVRPYAGIVGAVISPPHPVPEPIHPIMWGHCRHQSKETVTLSEGFVSVADHIGEQVSLQVKQNLLESVLMTTILPTADVGQVGPPVSFRLPRGSHRQVLPAGYPSLVAATFQSNCRPFGISGTSPKLAASCPDCGGGRKSARDAPMGLKDPDPVGT